LGYPHDPASVSGEEGREFKRGRGGWVDRRGVVVERRKEQG